MFPNAEGNVQQEVDDPNDNGVYTEDLNLSYFVTSLQLRGTTSKVKSTNKKYA